MTTQQTHLEHIIASRDIELKEVKKNLKKARDIIMQKNEDLMVLSSELALLKQELKNKKLN